MESGKDNAARAIIALAQDDPRFLPLGEVFQEAERRMKLMEVRCRKPPASVFNELRYAGCHMLRALCPSLGMLDENLEAQDHQGNESGENSVAKEIRRATDHCKRARYDAIEYDTTKCGELFDEFRAKYESIFSEDVYGLKDALRAGGEARALVEANANLKQRRDDVIQQLDVACNKFRDAVAQLIHCTPMLSARIEKKRTERFRFILKTALVVVGILSATAGWMVKSYFDYKASKYRSQEAAVVQHGPAPALPAPVLPTAIKP